MPRLYATKNATKVDFMRSRTKWQVNSDFEIKETNSINGQSLTFKSASALATLSSDTVTFTNMIPAGALLLCVDARVVTTITGPASWLLGVTGDTDRFGTGLALAAGTTVNSIISAEAAFINPRYYASAISVLITRGTAVDFATGAVRVTVHYIDLTPATS